jgi:hypothetical protein
MFDRLFGLFSGRDLIWTLIWLGASAILVGLAALSWSRWGQQNPLRKCIVLSVVAHLLFAVYATTVHVAVQSDLPGAGDNIEISLVEDEDWLMSDRDPLPDAEPIESAIPDEPLPLPEQPPSAPDLPAPPEFSPDEIRTASSESPAIEAPTGIGEPPNLEAGLEPAEISNDASALSPPAKPGPMPPEPDTSLPESSPELQSSSATITGERPPFVFPSSTESERSPRASPIRPAAALSVPSLYHARFSPDRLNEATRQGGSAESERGVQMALDWLARAQSEDGRWDASLHGAGNDSRKKGTTRDRAGGTADAGISGLALLAFLGAGQTHVNGDYQGTVERGLQFLVNGQARDGSLAQRANRFEWMYCHAMASFALSEAYAVTGDPRWHLPARRALDYTLAAQHQATGGWRYQPNQPGDTSQLGWQLMAVKSAEIAGLPVPAECQQGMIRFLKSVSAGPTGGLACYKPGERVTSTMTAEALACRLFLGQRPTNPASLEAGEFLLEDLPRANAANVYYWYYGTLAMHSLGGPYWEAWNEALLSALLSAQRIAGFEAGSWDPDAEWGTYGGRVYQTALSTLCLEVYYRYQLDPPLTARQEDEPRATR